MRTPQSTLDTLRVLIVDDHALIAQGVAVALEAEGVSVRVTTGPTLSDVLQAADDHRPDVVLLDLQLEGNLGTGRDLIVPLRERGAKVLVLTGVTDRILLAECLEQGAAGVLGKSAPFDDLISAVLRAGNGDHVVPEPDRIQMLQDLHSHRLEERERFEPFERLTPREAGVLGDLLAGKQADAIATDNYVSIATVRSQIRAVLQKLDVNSQLAAVALARELGWSPTPD